MAGSPLRSRSIGQPLPDDAAKGFVGPLRVVDAIGDALVVPEVELGKVAVQMLFAAMLIDALHPALEDAEKAFDGVGVERPAPVFAGLMLHHLMIRELAPDLGVVAGFVGHQTGFAVHVLKHDRADSLGVELFDHH